MSKSIGNVVDPRTVMLGGKDQKKVRPSVDSMRQLANHHVVWQ